MSLTLAQGEVPVPVALRLFLPEAWTDDPARCARAGVPPHAIPAAARPEPWAAPPEAEVIARGKGEIALAELERVLAAGGRFGIVLADAGYDATAEFRHGLDARGQLWAVGIPRNKKIYGADVQLAAPTRRKRRPAPDEEPRAAEDVLARMWHVTWRQGTKKALTARVAVTRVRVGDALAPWSLARRLATTAICPATKPGW